MSFSGGSEFAKASTILEMKESTQTSPAENSDDSIVTWLLYFKRTSDKIAFAEFQKSVKTTSSSSLALMLATTNQAIYAYFSMIGSHSSRVFSLLFVLILLLVVYGWTLLLTSIIMDQKRKMLQSGRVVRSNSNATGISSGEGEDSFVTDKSISSEAVEETKKTLSAEVLPSRNFVTDTIIAAATKLADRFSNQLDHNVMDTILILGISLYSGLRLMTRTIQGQCYDNSYLNSFGCNPYFAAGGIPPDTLFGISLLPLMVASLSRYAGWTTVLSSWVISILFMSLSAIINGEKSYGLLWGIAVAYIPCSAIVLFETRRQNIDIFLVNRDLNQVVTENKKMAEAIRKDELRSMIGNIAHDLKTVCSFFLYSYSYS